MQVWLNGSLLPATAARVSVFDRGFLFGEGVYESVRICEGRTPFLARHVARLGRSLSAIGMDAGLASALSAAVAELIAAERLADGNVYLQITRGGSPGVRRHVPDADSSPTIVAFALPAPAFAAAPVEIAAITRPDQRWHRCDIKCTSLLGNVLALADAEAAEAEEAILVRDGLVSEGAYTNVFVAVGGRLHTPALDGDTPILGGVNREVLLEALREAGTPCLEGPLPQANLAAASEILVTSSRRLASAVTRLDGRPVGDGRIGPFARRAYELLRRASAVSTHDHAPAESNA